MSSLIVRTPARIMSFLLAVTLAAGALAAITLADPPAARAADFGPGALVADQPASNTPHALDGNVRSVVRIGDTIVLGGTFTQARNFDSETELTRNRVLSFNANTGQINTAFNPAPNGPVNVVLPAGDGTSVYVGGSFSSIGGVARTNLARVRLSDGAVLPFNAGSVTGQVKDLALQDGRLWLGGAFTHVQGTAQKALATVDPNTGALDQYMRLQIAGTHNGGYTTVAKLDIDPAGDKLLALGNFDTLEGVQNRQLLSLDISGAAAAPGGFRTQYYETPCSSSFDAYVRDVNISPDGSFFVVVTTGAYGGQTQACDTSARFETDAVGDDVAPSWINTTGGDTSWSVEVTDSVVYVGGHQRWQNNPFAGDRAGQGAVSRPGIAALSPINGLPFTWNPTRTRGVGVFDFLVDNRGLWVASDTDRIGAYHYRGRIALMPHAGGTAIPAGRTPTLPNDVYQGGPIASGGQVTNALSRRAYQPGTVGATAPVAGGGLDWRNVRGAFMLNGQLYLGASDGSFTRRSFDGASYGAPVPVNGADLLVPLTNWQNDIKSATSMFYDSGRIYFTLSGSNTLYYRYFNIESDVVGAYRHTAATGIAGVNLSQTNGAFTDGNHLYRATNDGVLRRMTWAEGAQSDKPVTPETAVSGPAIDGIRWSARTLFLYQGSDGGNAPVAPTADFVAACDSVDCGFDAGQSTAPGRTITAYAWNFGDGTTGTGKTPSHTYAGSGTRSVTLTITTNDNATATVTKPVAVTAVNRAPVAVATGSCVERECAFDGSGSSDPDANPLTYAWDFGDGTTGTGANPTHTYGVDGPRTVTLTVSDGAASDSTTVSVNPSAAALAQVGAASTAGNRSIHSVQIPGSVQAGDTLLLFLTTNSTTTTVTDAVPGWTLLESQDGSGVRGRLWKRTATAADAGSTASVSTSGYAKSALAVTAYRSSTGTAAVTAYAGAVTSGSTSHSTPALSASAPNSWLVSYWSEKSSPDQVWTPPAAATVRTEAGATGSGKVSAILADSGASVPLGPTGGLSATTSETVSRAVTYSVVIAPQ